jgi:hypothetical protein
MVSSKSGVKKTAVIALIVIIVAGGITAAYIALRPPNSSSSPYTHTVKWTTMANHQTDFWNITVTNPYTVVLNDTMTASSGNQFLEVDGVPEGGQGVEGAWAPMWTVYFVNNTTFDWFIHAPNGSMVSSGSYLPYSGTVQVVATSTQITFSGISSGKSNMPFENLVQIVTANEGGNFNGGQLDIALTRQT